MTLEAWLCRAAKQASKNARMAELAMASGLALPADMMQARPDALGGAERDGLGERAAPTRVGDATCTILHIPTVTLCMCMPG